MSYVTKQTAKFICIDIATHSVEARGAGRPRSVLCAICGANCNGLSWPWSGCVVPMLVRCHFKQLANIKLFLKLGKSVEKALVNINAVYGY